MSSQAVLILGAGANVGKSLAQKFAGNGFKVAAASRTINPELAKAVHASTKVDFSTPSSIKDTFNWAKSKIGIPNVVVYNGRPANTPKLAQNSS
jgi:NAD(P)-dependent dehydrogenase (short-subunit alcohol dehydrogenase family)